MEKGGQTSDFELNQYTTIIDQQKGTRKTLVHDEVGNLTRDGKKQYFYNYRDQISQFIDNAKPTADPTREAVYYYDALGRRVLKHFPLDSSQDIYYFCDGDQVLEETDEAGNLQKEYIYNIQIDEVVKIRVKDTSDFDEDGNTTEFLEFFYHCNSIGTVIALTDNTGNVVER